MTVMAEVAAAAASALRSVADLHRSAVAAGRRCLDRSRIAAGGSRLDRGRVAAGRGLYRRGIATAADGSVSHGLRSAAAAAVIAVVSAAVTTPEGIGVASEREQTDDREAARGSRLPSIPHEQVLRCERCVGADASMIRRVARSRQANRREANRIEILAENAPSLRSPYAV
jgi:hypothetical protein